MERLSKEQISNAIFSMIERGEVAKDLMGIGWEYDRSIKKDFDGDFQKQKEACDLLAETFFYVQRK